MDAENMYFALGKSELATNEEETIQLPLKLFGPDEFKTIAREMHAKAGKGNLSHLTFIRLTSPVDTITKIIEFLITVDIPEEHHERWSEYIMHLVTNLMEAHTVVVLGSLFSSPQGESFKNSLKEMIEKVEKEKAARPKIDGYDKFSMN